MAFNLDPYGVQQMGSVPQSVKPPTLEEIEERRKRLEQLGLDKGLLGDINDLSGKAAKARGQLQEQARGYVAQKMGLSSGASSGAATGALSSSGIGAAASSL
jgi:hypothetical protein